MRLDHIAIKAIIFAALFLTACTSAASYMNPDDGGPSPSAAEINAAAEQAATEDPTSSPNMATNPAVSSSSLAPTEPPVESIVTDDYPVINRRVDVPDNIRVNWLLSWDAIRPVYNPEFATVEDAPLDDDELIIGISLKGEAKAYPITVLRSREMVNDEMAGIPTLVTW